MDGDLAIELRAFISELVEEEGLRTTVFEVAKGGAMAFVGACAGGMLGGPIGMFLGSSLMGGLASVTCKNFQPLHQVLAEMPEHRWRLLENRFKRIMENRGVMDVIGLATLAVSGTALRQQMVMEVLDFAQKELGRSVVGR